MINAKKGIRAAALLILAISLGLFSFFNKNEIEFPVSKKIALDSPYIVRDYGELRYILDKQRTRIIVVEKESNLVRHVLPPSGRQPDNFFYADDFLVDADGNVYVKEGAWDGNRISREAVLVYDANGRYKATYLDTTYDSMVNKHKVMLLSVGDGKINYAVKNKDLICTASFDIQSGTEVKKEFPYKDAFDFVNDMAQSDGGKIFVLDKAGRLFQLSENEPELIYSAAHNEFPNWIESNGEDSLLYSELYSDSVMELNLQSGEKKRVLTASGFVTVSPVSSFSIENPVKNSSILRKQIFLLFIFILFAVSSLLFIGFGILSFLKSNLQIIQRISVYTVIVAMAVAGTVTFKLTNEFSKVMRSQILAQMENMAYSVANSIRPTTLDSIQEAADFASEDYREMIRSMESVIDCNLDVNHNVYCDIFKYDDAHGAYACAYLDQAIGTYFPLTQGETEEIKQIYETGRAVSSSKDDTSASYTYVSVPVINDFGRVCGVVSVMTENFMLDNKINDMKKSVLLGLVVTLIFVWLLMGEALSYILSKSQAELEAKEEKSRSGVEEKIFPHYYIRLIVFALFAAYNMTTTFLPLVITRGALESLGEEMGNFAAALPISVNLFIIGLMALFCEGIIRRIGCKKIIAAGTILSAVSNLIIFAFPLSYTLLFVALVIDGIGVGLTTNSMYLMVSQIPSPKNRASGYVAYNAAQISGINFGMLFGAALASTVGRHLIFPLVSAMWILSALLFVLLWRTLGLDSAPAESQDSVKERRTFGRVLPFILKKRVWSFIILIQAPFALMGGFIYYYLPLYSDTHGLSEVAVAALMMLYSFFAIYLGNGLTKWVIQKTGRLSPYTPVVLSAVAVLLYAFIGNLPGLLSAIFVLGLANGFGRSVQQTQFSILDECEEYGVADAMGVFNFTDFIGQSFGPAVMALVFLSKNVLASTGTFAIVLVILSIVHIVINFSKPKK